MASLLDRIAREDWVPREDWIRGHEFEASLELYLQGHVTESQVKAALDLTDKQVDQINVFKAHFDGLGTAIQKLAYFHDAIACVTALQLGKMSKTLFKSILGLGGGFGTTTTTT